MSVPNVGAMRAVAERLDRVGLRYAFVGGSIVNLLVDHPELIPARPTDDVDVIIELISGVRYSEVEARLRAVGFSHDMRQGAPNCRWTLEGVTVDIMPTDGAGLGLNTTWFAEALATATMRTVAHTKFPIVSPVAFLATKYTAFLDRGNGDYYGSHDLEDFMAVVDGRSAIVSEIDQAPVALRTFVITGLQQLLAAPAFHGAVPGFLPPDEGGRIPLLRRKLAAITTLRAAGTLTTLAYVLATGPSMRAEPVLSKSVPSTKPSEGRPQHCMLIADGPLGRHTAGESETWRRRRDSSKNGSSWWMSYRVRCRPKSEQIVVAAQVTVNHLVAAAPERGSGRSDYQLSP